MDQYYFSTRGRLNKRKVWIFMRNEPKMTLKTDWCAPNGCITVDIQIGQFRLFKI